MMTPEERITALEAEVEALKVAVNSLILEQEGESVGVFEAGHRRFHDDVVNGRVLGG